VPAVGLEALAPIFGEGKLCGTLDGDAVVVIEIDELAQLQMAGQRGCLGRHAFHQVTVSDDAEGVMVDDVVARPVVDRRQVRFSDGHAHAVAQACAQRAGRGLNARRQAIFRVARCEAAPLAEALQLVQRQIVPCQVQQGVD